MSGLPSYEYTREQRARLTFFMFDCGYFVIDGPTRNRHGEMDVTIKHPQGQPLRYLINVKGHSCLVPTRERAA